MDASHCTGRKGMRWARASRAACVAPLLGALLLSLPLRAAELAGLRAPERITLEDRDLRLNGIGLRTVRRLLIRADIYAAALYLESPSRDAAEVLASDGLKQITLRYLYAIDAEDMQRAWAYSFEQNCPEGDCSRFEAAIERFLALVEAVEDGDTYVFRFYRDRSEVLREGTSLGTIPGAGFTKLLLSTWIGVAPPTEELKASLLAGGAH